MRQITLEKQLLLKIMSVGSFYLLLALDHSSRAQGQIHPRIRSRNDHLLLRTRRWRQSRHHRAQKWWQSASQSLRAN